MVNIKSFNIVLPFGPTPNKKSLLSDIDQIKLWNHVSLVYIYKSQNSISSDNSLVPVIEIMRNSLSQALVFYYPLAGRLHWSEGGRLELDCKPKGVQLLVADSEATLDDLCDFAPTQALKEIVPTINYVSAIEEMPLLVVQLTRFRCGGLGVGVALCRAMLDGTATFGFINSWVKLARGEKLNLVPFHDRNVLKSSGKLMKPCFDHIEFKQLPTSKAESNNKSSIVMLKVTKEQVENLKKMANQFYKEDQNVGQQRPFSRFEVLAGHIWRCACKARYKGNSRQPTKVCILVDCRSRLKPPLPVGYFGNATLPTVTPLCLFDDLILKPLSYAAGKISRAIDNMTDEYIRSAIGFIVSHRDMDLLRTSYQTQDSNLNIVSWMNMPIDGADFGFGKPPFFGPGSINSEGKAFIMSSCDNDGSLNVPFRLNAAHMDAFKKLFYEDIGDAGALESDDEADLFDNTLWALDYLEKVDSVRVPAPVDRVRVPAQKPEAKRGGGGHWCAGALEDEVGCVNQRKTASAIPYLRAAVPEDKIWFRKPDKKRRGARAYFSYCQIRI